MMKNLTSKVIIATFIASLLSGCVTGTASREDKMANGAALGALAGGLLAFNVATPGSNLQWAWVYFGVAAGGIAGYKIMDEVTLREKQELDGMIYKSLTESENGDTLTWHASEQETMGHFTPIRTFMDTQGRICRDLMVESVVDGEKNQATQTMCKNGAGHWIVS